jgi:hypothetical protein
MFSPHQEEKLKTLSSKNKIIKEKDMPSLIL